MSNRRNPTPSYLLHQQSGRARAVWTDSLGERKQKLLPGEYESAESRAAFARLQLDLLTAPIPRNDDHETALSVNELLLGFLAHADKHYRRADGTATHEVEEYKLVARHLRELYGDTPARAFGPLALKALRERFIAAQWCRGLVNQRIGRVRRVFKWGASEELVPITVHQALATVPGLQRGRTAARESPPVRPVSDAVVAATLPFLNRHVRGLVRFQRLTGCRPGEACAVRMCEIDASGAVWRYRPRQHKTAWRGKEKVIAIGPAAQEVLREFITPDPTAYLFSPARAVAELHASRGAARKTPKYPSHVTRNERVRKRTPKRAPAELYDVNSYGHAIDRACARAFPPPEPLAQRPDETEKAWLARLTAEQREELRAWHKKHSWHPNRLRHAFATSVRKGHGLEAAQVLLGHARADVTQVYAEKNEALAVQLAAEIG